MFVAVGVGAYRIALFDLFLIHFLNRHYFGSCKCDDTTKGNLDIRKMGDLCENIEILLFL